MWSNRVRTLIAQGFVLGTRWELDAGVFYKLYSDNRGLSTCSFVLIERLSVAIVT